MISIRSLILAMAIIFQLGHCFIQEFTLHYELNDKETSAIHRHLNFNLTTTTNMTNVKDYKLSYPYAPKRCCYIGEWRVYARENYQGVMLTADSYDMKCETSSTFDDFGSLRFLGPSNTSENTISLYYSTVGYGDELIIEEEAYSGLNSSLYNFMLVSGTSGWRVFEGSLFNGTSACIPAPNKTLGWFNLKNLPFPTFGSILQGTMC